MRLFLAALFLCSTVSADIGLRGLHPRGMGIGKPKAAAPTGGGGGTFANDTFTGSDTTSITAHTSDSGHSWTKNTSSVGSYDLQINGNEINPTSASSVMAWYSSAVPASADYSVSIRWGCGSTANVSLMPVARLTTSGLSFYGARYSSATWYLYKWVGGSFTEITTAAETAGNTPTTATRKITIKCTGTTIQVLVDDASVISVTDSSITAAGRPGIGAFYSDVSTSFTQDDWDAQ